MYSVSFMRIRRTFVLISFIWVALFCFCGMIDSSVAQAQGKILPEAVTTPGFPVSQGLLHKVNEYFSTQNITYSDGTRLERDLINGPPKPPPGYELERSAVSLPEPDPEMGTNTLTVPAFNWVFGCSSVSGAMIAGYYDRNGYPNMYTGPTNGGVMPLDNSSWPTWSDGYTTYPNLPLAASHQGVDGRVTRGSIDDYWINYGSSTQDPYITNSWTQHNWGDGIGDYMKTSQSAYGNTDGSTSFWNYNSATRLYCSAMPGFGITNDGTYGRKLFYEARGYTVTDCYNQKTDNIVPGGFSFAQYRAEVDAGRPVMLNLEGHTIVGVGYDDSSNMVYIHDTWSYSNHTMTWGGSYSGMQLLSVSIVNLQTMTPPSGFNKSSPTNGTTGQATNLTLSWGSSTGATSYEYCIDTINNDSCESLWVSTGTSTNVVLNLSQGMAYYWQVRANNAGGTTYANSNVWWSFVTSGSHVVNSPKKDFDGDGKTDVAVWRPGDGNWYIRNSLNGSVTVQQWGANWLKDVPVPGNYDGDSKTDIAVWRPLDGNWYIRNSATAIITVQQWGAGSLGDVPVPGDYDGDGKTDIAVWRPGEGNWYIRNSATSTVTVQQWGSGALNDVPVPGDYDGDGKTDIAVWRPGDGNWFIRNSATSTLTIQEWGEGSLGDIPVPGDYDGDGKTDIAIWRPSDGNWYIRNSATGTVTVQQWGSGALGDVPVPGDYDGDGKTDIAVWRPGDGNWYIRNSETGTVTVRQWGANWLNDIPISTNTIIYRQVKGVLY